MHKRFYITIGIVLLGIAAWHVFGFKELAIEEVETPVYYVVGQKYKGFAGDDQVKKNLQETEKLLEQGNLQGELSVWYYGNPDQNKDSLMILVGAVSTDSAASVPTMYVKEKIEGGQVVRAVLDPKEIFGPTPDEVNERLLDHAIAKKLGNQAYLYVEKYVAKDDNYFIWCDIYVK